MSVPFVDLETEYDILSEEISDAVQRTLQSGRFILDAEVNRFEDAFAEYIGVDHAVGVNSGSDALELALRALDIGAGDEVITPSHTYAATANAIVEAGAVPKFADVSDGTYCLTPDAVEENITPNTAAVIPVHIYGQPCDMDRIREIALEYDLYIVEDAAQAHGATYRDQRVGSIGDVGCFSFYPVKNLGAYGDGGMVVTDDEAIARTVDVLRNCGEAEKYRHERVGRNSRLDEIQAAILNEKLPYLDEWNKHRRTLAATYDELLSGTPVTTPQVVERRGHVYHLYVVRSDRRDELQSHLDEYGVQTLVHYPVPVHQQPPYREYETGSLTVTENICDRILSLPISPWHTREDVEYVCDVIRDFTHG